MMIPSISPPSDNLYKFIAIFGLAIFLFALHKSGEVFEKANKNNIELEDIRIEISRSFAYNSLSVDVLNDSTSQVVVPKMLTTLSTNLDEMENQIKSASLDPLKKEELLSQVRKKKILLHGLRIRTTEFYCTLFLGLLLMAFGFLFWYRKEQSLKDKLIALETQRKLSEVGPKNV